MTTSTLNGTDDSGPTRDPRGSIADRMRSLQEAGLSVGTPARVPRELPLTLRTPLELQSLSSTPPQPTTSSPHTFIPTSGLGPPSPASSTSTSPKLSHPKPSESTVTFSSLEERIDELEERMDGLGGHLEGLQTKSVLTASDFLPHPFSSTPPPPPSLPSFEQSSPSVGGWFSPRQLYDLMHKPGLKVLFLDVRSRSEYDQEHIKADAVVRIEPSVLSIEPVTVSSIEDSLAMGPRSERTLFQNWDKFDVVAIYDADSKILNLSDLPLQKLYRVFYRSVFGKSLKMRTILLRGGLEAWKQDIGEAELTRTPPSPLVPSPEKLGPPVATYISPRQLYDFMRQPGLKVLLLDIRSRSEYDREHIKADAVVCMEPSALLNQIVTASSIEYSLAMGPSSERTLFQNWHEFDVVAIYDAESKAPNPPLSKIYRAIMRTAFDQSLEGRITMLIGGLKAWKQDIGEAELTRTSEPTMSAVIAEGLGRKETSPDAGGYLVRGILKGDGDEHLFAGTGDLPSHPAPKKYPQNGAAPPLSLARPQIMEDDVKVAGAPDHTFRDVTIWQDEHESDCQCVIQ